MPQSELNSILDIDRAIKQIDNQISEIDRQRSVLMTERKQLYENRQQLTAMNDVSTPVENVSHYSSQNEKIALFRSLFRGREDVFPRRFESVMDFFSFSCQSQTCQKIGNFYTDPDNGSQTGNRYGFI
jgi:hypothetical protein